MSAVAVLAAAACTSPPTSAPPVVPSTQPATPARRPAPGPDTGWTRFEQQQLDRAERAQRAGRHAEAVLSWEALALLRPSHEPYRAGLASARRTADAELAQRLSRATAARQRGDLAGAERAWLDALAVDPRNAVAARGLRELEAERTRASSVGRFATPPALALANGGPAATPSVPRAAVRTTALPGPRNVVEHVTLLAGQGETDAAITLLADQYGASPADPAVRRLMADLHLQRAEQVAPRDAAAAVSDLERALALNPRLESARTRLQQLRRVDKPR